MKKMIKLISIVAMTLFSAFSLQGQGFMTLSCENRDEDLKASLAIKMTSPSGKQTTFKEEDLTAKVLGYELAEKGIYNIDYATQTYIDLKRFCDKKGVKVFNATRGGKLEVYPRVDFDSLFNKEEQK